MIRFLTALVLMMALVLSAKVVAAAADAPKIDGDKIEALFKKLDANSDGKLSKDEFKKLAELGQGKLKDNPELIDKLFEKLDTNADGTLSKDEFKKLSELKKKD